MRWANYLLGKIAQLLGVSPESLKYWDAFGQLSHFKSGIPKVLITTGAEQFFRGFLNQTCISTHLDWLWPYWVNQQFYPRSHDFVARGLQLYTTNLTHRNWTAIGHPDGKIEPIVDPRGLVTPFQNSWSLDFLIFYEGELFAPAKMEKVNQYLENNLPIVVTELSVKELEIKSEVFVGKSEVLNSEFIFEKINVKNNSSEKVAFTIAYSIRPYNPEGISLINKIEYSAFGIVLINEKLGVVFQESPTLVICSNLEKGDSVSRYKKQERQLYSFCPAGLANALVAYQVILEPNESEFFEARIPIESFKPTVKKITEIQKMDFQNQKDKIINLWHDKLKKSTIIKFNDENLQSAFEANKAFLRLFFDQDKITPGPFTYHYFWTRDAVFMTYALQVMGFMEEARAVINSLLKTQKSDGAFLTEAGEWDSVGQVLWITTRHFRFTNDVSFLKDVYQKLIKAVKWIENHRNVKIPQDDILFGLLPPGLSAEHFGYMDYYYWDNYWALAGLREVLETSKLIGIIEDKTFLEKLSWEYGVDLDHSLEKAFSKIGEPCLPISPRRGMDSAAIGSLVALYPLRFFSPYDQRIINTINYLEKNCLIDNGFFHDVNHSGFGTYLTMHLAECYLFQKNPKVWEIIDWLLNHTTSTFCWPEAIHPITGGGCMGDGHHGWAVAEFLILLRNLCFFEEYDRLIITPKLREKFFEKEGEIIYIEKAPSCFGIINFSLKKFSETIEYEFNNQYHLLPREIEINLPYEPEWVKIDGVPYHFIGSQIFCSPLVKHVEIKFKK